MWKETVIACFKDLYQHVTLEGIMEAMKSLRIVSLWAKIESQDS
jgi:hypothetical protein